MPERFLADNGLNWKLSDQCEKVGAPAGGDPSYFDIVSELEKSQDTGFGGDHTFWVFKVVLPLATSFGQEKRKQCALVYLLGQSSGRSYCSLRKLHFSKTEIEEQSLALTQFLTAKATL